MNIFENNYEIIEDTVVTIGKFDGLHEGHKKLINMTIEEAKKRKCKSLVYTFNQNPKEILKKEKINSLISKEEKIHMLTSMGIDYIVFQDFTYEFSRIYPEDFAKEIVKGKLKAVEVIVGFNYRFGRDAKGDTESIERYGKKYGFSVKVVKPVTKDGIVISSSLIRGERANKSPLLL